MSALGGLAGRVASREATVAVVGLGYVGLPAACLLADAGFTVAGVDVKASRVDMINRGVCPIEGREPGLAELLQRVVAEGRLQATTDTARLADVDVILVAVDTPVEADHKPRYDALRIACAGIGAHLKPGALVVVESTIAPGTIAGVVRPALETASGLRAGADFGLGHCPERVMPGKLLRNMRTMARVLGAGDPDSSAAMRALYSTYVEAGLEDADPLTAELVKTSENAYRDVQIAFANQVALVCEAVGGDVWKVRELVNQSPGREMLLPGPGVGGHCIPKDSWLLAQPLGADAGDSLLGVARGVNDAMPAWTARLVERTFKEAGFDRPRVAVLGYAYLENSDDTRNSPTEAFVNALEAAGAEVRIHDPWVEKYRGDLLQTAHGCDGAVVMVAHQEYRTVDLERLRGVLRGDVLVDARAVIDPGRARAAGFRYRRLGTAGKATEGAHA